MEPIEPIEPINYQRELALSLAVQWTAKSVFDENRVIDIAELFLNWLNNVEVQ
jgi:hypothetical protein